MSKLRRKFITVLAVLCCVLLTLTAISFLPKSKTANAARGNNWTEIGEIYKGNGEFGAKNMRLLYQAITGNKNATYETVKSTLNSAATDNNGTHHLTSQDVRDNNSGNNVSVWFGGIKWDVTYITTDKSGNIVVDLWQSADGANNIQSGQILPTSVFQTHSENHTSNRYPSSMYSVSVVRVVALNAGGYTTTNDTTLNSTLKTQNTLNLYAKFTMANPGTGVDSLTNFIVKPQDVAYQETENSNGNSTMDFTLSNDAYGTPTATDSAHPVSWCTEGGAQMDYSINDSQRATGAKYGDWQSDYLWLPSLAETGNSDNQHAAAGEIAHSANGIWKTNTELRSAVQSATWLRSTARYTAHNATVLNTSGSITNYSTNTSYAVRPALHFNLTAADAVRGTDFGTDDTTEDEDNGVKTAELSDTYSGNDVTINIPDNDRLTFGGADIAHYNTTTGEFTVKEPNTNSDRTYEITVTPKSGYYWDDTNNATERTATRKYKITIKLAEISVAWTSKTVATGQGLLQGTNLITVFGGSTVENTISQQFYVVEPNGTDTPPANWLTDGGWNVSWQQRNDSSNYFKANQTGTYTVYYEIEAYYHTLRRGSYTVTASADAVRISTNSNITINNEIFGDKNADDLKSDLIGNFADWVTMTSDTSGVYSGSALQALLSKLEVVLLDENGMEVQPDTGHNYYSAGTYSLGLQYIPALPSTDKTQTFVWDTDKPQLTIEKRPITVNIVVANSGDSFTHVYGDNPVSMKCELDNINDLPTGESFDDLAIRSGVFRIKGTTTELNSRTSADTYDITGVAWDSNYEVNFESVQYTITPRPITLQVADEEVEYGTDFEYFTYKPMTRTGGTLASGDTISALTANATYSLYQNGDVAFSTTLAIGEYELRATIPSGNYVFTVNAGKLTIIKANFDMSGVTLENAGHIYDGQPHAMTYTGTLPSNEITVSYSYVNYESGEELDGPPTEVGLYIVYASFTHNSPNHNEITDKVAYLRIALTQDDLNQPYPDIPTDDELAQNAADLENKKQQAKDNLENAANKKKDEIDNSDMTDEEKEEARKKVEDELQKGKEAIDSATSLNGVDSAENTAKNNINNISTGSMGSSSFPWWMVAVAAGALLLITLIIIIVKRRQTADGEDEYDDYYDDEYDFDEEEYEEEDFGDEY